MVDTTLVDQLCTARFVGGVVTNLRQIHSLPEKKPWWSWELVKKPKLQSIDSRGVGGIAAHCDRSPKEVKILRVLSRILSVLTFGIKDTGVVYELVVLNMFSLGWSLKLAAKITVCPQAPRWTRDDQGISHMWSGFVQNDQSLHGNMLQHTRNQKKLLLTPCSIPWNQSNSWLFRLTGCGEPQRQASLFVDLQLGSVSWDLTMVISAVSWTDPCNPTEWLLTMKSTVIHQPLIGPTITRYFTMVNGR